MLNTFFIAKRIWITKIHLKIMTKGFMYLHRFFFEVDPHICHTCYSALHTDGRKFITGSRSFWIASWYFLLPGDSKTYNLYKNYDQNLYIYFYRYVDKISSINIWSPILHIWCFDRKFISWCRIIWITSCFYAKRTTRDDIHVKTTVKTLTNLYIYSFKVSSNFAFFIF